jgi:hypothetical protein
MGIVEIEDAEAFLLTRLKAGPVKANDVIDEARQEGIAERFLKWAKRNLGVRSKKESEPTGTWFWELPEKNEPKGADAAAHISEASLGDVADEILRAIQRNPNGMSRTAIRDIFGRHQSGARLRAALALLASKGLARKGARQAVGRGGRPTEIWTAAERDSKKSSPEVASSEPKSNDQDAPVTANPNGTERGLNDLRIRQLAEWYAERACRLYSPATTAAVVLDPELRAILRREVGSELAELEFARVLKIVRRQ